MVDGVRSPRGPLTYQEYPGSIVCFFFAATPNAMTKHIIYTNIRFTLQR